MEKNKTNNTAVCIICGILTTFGLALSVFNLVQGLNGILLVKDIIDIVMTLLIGYYAFKGYLKPHGNLLKYIILVFAAILLVSVYLKLQLGTGLTVLLPAISIGLLCYSAGRLHKVKQNTVLFGIVTMLLVLSVVLAFVDGYATIGAFTPVIIWLDICAAYFLRYKEHKEAGLIDAPKE